MARTRAAVACALLLLAALLPDAAAQSGAREGVRPRSPGAGCLGPNEPCQSAQQCCGDLSCLAKSGQQKMCVGIAPPG